MNAGSEPHVVSMVDYSGVDHGWEEDFFESLSEDFDEVQVLEDGQYEVRTFTGSSARIDYKLEFLPDDFSEFSAEIYGAESAVRRVNRYLESEFAEAEVLKN